MLKDLPLDHLSLYPFICIIAVQQKLNQISLLDPLVIVRLFIRSYASDVFSAMTMNSVGKAANEMIEEVRRQFRENKGIMEGNAKPDYARCVHISTGAALHEMIAPGLLAIIAPLLIDICLVPSSRWNACWIHLHPKFFSNHDG